MYKVGETNIIKGGLAPYYNPILELLLNNSTRKNQKDGKSHRQRTTVNYQTL